MGELVPAPKQPEPVNVEPKHKIQAKCWHCDKVVQSSLANCLTTIFAKQPWNSYTSLGCLDKKCQAVTILFHDQVSEETADRSVQYPTTIEEFCDQEDILEVRRDLLHLTDVTSHELSDRQDRIVGHWGEFLQSVIVDLSDFPEAPPSAFR